MSAEGIPESSPIIGEPKERLSKIYKIIETHPLVGNAEEAHKIVFDAMETIENESQKAGLRSTKKMAAMNFTGMRCSDVAGHKIRARLYDKHVMFIGDNGAIAIYRYFRDKFPAAVTLEDLVDNPKKALLELLDESKYPNKRDCPLLEECTKAGLVDGQTVEKLLR